MSRKEHFMGKEGKKLMENRIIDMTKCDRKTANLIANEVLDLDREAEYLLKDTID